MAAITAKVDPAFTVLLSTLIPFLNIKAQRPTVKEKRRTFCPNMLPKDNSGTLFIADMIPMKNSGAMAPIEAVKATTNSFQPKYFATLLKESINHLVDETKKKQETKKITM